MVAKKVRFRSESILLALELVQDRCKRAGGDSCVVDLDDLVDYTMVARSTVRYYLAELVKARMIFKNRGRPGPAPAGKRRPRISVTLLKAGTQLLKSADSKARIKAIKGFNATVAKLAKPKPKKRKVSR